MNTATRSDIDAEVDGSLPEDLGVTEIPDSVLARIRSEAVESYPEECCGFLVGTREDGGELPGSGAAPGLPARVRVRDALATPNVAGTNQRRREFMVDPAEVLRVMKDVRERDEELVGFYHSHPNHPAELSPTDLRFARLWPRTAWLIVPVERTPAERASDDAPALSAGRERAWWIPHRELLNELEGIQEMTVRSPGDPGRTSTPRGDTE